MCECGREVLVLKTMECKRCYNARWREENLEKRRAQDRAAQARRYEPVPLVHTAAAPPTTACSYEVAHQRVAQYRGKASTHVCACGAQANEWSYRNHSAYEMSGPRRGQEIKWSTHVKDYDPLCRPCHDIRDGKTSKSFSGESTKTPAAATTFLSPQEAHNGL